MLIHNELLHKFMELELPKDTNKLSAEEKEQLARNQAKKMVTSQLTALRDFKGILGSSEETKVIEEGKHKLIEMINDETSFWICKLPNEDCFNYSLTTSSICFVKEVELTEASVLFVAVAGKP